MPGDGNLTHNAPFEPVVAVDQLDWTAQWADYDWARRRLNAAEVWQKGGDLGAFVKNTIFAAILAVSLLTGFASFRAGGAAGQLSTDVGDLRAAILRAGVPVGAVTPVPVPTATAAIGLPTGDRPTPTVRLP